MKKNKWVDNNTDVKVFEVKVYDSETYYITSISRELAEEKAKNYFNKRDPKVESHIMQNINGYL